MFGLTWKLAVSNLQKNRSLYYPFALATVLAVAISYIFCSLTFNPHLFSLKGASTIYFTLILGMVIVFLATSIIILYANSFVMKNRSKEMGIYGMLGLEKRHLISMVFKELTLFGLATFCLGIGFGIIFDNLVYAILLYLIRMPVGLHTNFNPLVVIFVACFYVGVFLLLFLLNAWRILRFDPLKLSREKNAGEKKGRFLKTQTVLGLISTGVGYYLALSVKDPLSAILLFFLAVLLVVIGTYLLFNAGTTVFLQLLQKNKSYYYKPNNFISVSNLIFRMKKNAVGLATISILSTMVLVSLTMGVSLQVSGDRTINQIAPADFNINGQNVEKSQIEEVLTDFQKTAQVKEMSSDIFTYQTLGINAYSNGTFDVAEGYEALKASPFGILLAFSQEDYEKITGKKVELAPGQAMVYASSDKVEAGQTLNFASNHYQVKEIIKNDFTVNKIPNQYSLFSKHVFLLVVADLDQVQVPAGKLNQKSVIGHIDVQASDKELESYLMTLSQLAQDKTAAINQTSEGQQDQDPHYITIVDRQTVAQGIYGLVGGVFFIAIFLSLVFLTGAVLVIYYKQISEGYEDRERFQILQKVGLDEKQTKATIRKQVLTVFFLPLIFAFVHLAFAYHMIYLIVYVIVGESSSLLMLMVTVAICAIFVLVYLFVFALTSRSYRRIVSAKA